MASLPLHRQLAPWPLLVLATALLDCSSSDTSADEDVLRACPSAPIRHPADQTRSILDYNSLPQACAFDGECMYAPSTSLGTPHVDTCNTMACYCREGLVRCSHTLAGCDDIPPTICPADRIEGEACEMVDPQLSPVRPYRNGECLSGGDESGQGATHACACDLPGPLWRCVPL